MVRYKKNMGILLFPFIWFFFFLLIVLNLLFFLLEFRCILYVSFLNVSRVLLKDNESIYSSCVKVFF